MASSTHYTSKQGQERWQLATSLEDKGHALLKKVAKLSAEDKFQQACVIFEEAAKQYTVLSQWTRAGECYVACGDSNKRLRQEHLAASYYIQAGESFSKFDPMQAVVVYRKAVLHMKNLGHYSVCANIEMGIAKLHHEDLAHEEAGKAYENAALYYRTDAFIAQAVKAIVLGGMEYVRVGRYEHAHQFYSRAYKWSLEHNLLRARSNGYALDAAICYLADKKLKKCKRFVRKVEQNSILLASREYRFIQDIIHCCETGSYDTYIDHVWNMDYVRKLWPFELVLFQAIFDNIKNTRKEVEHTEAELREKKLEQLKRGGSDADTVSTWSGSGEESPSEEEQPETKG